MTVQKTAEVADQIKKHKRWFERSELFSYSLQFEEGQYYRVRYARFGKMTGNLILTPDGAVPPFETAKEVFTVFDNYNSCIFGAANVIEQAKEQPMLELEQLRELLTNVVLPLDVITSSSGNDVRAVLDVVNFCLGMKERMGSIYEEMRAIDSEMHQRGFLTVDEVKKVDELAGEYNRLVYERHRKDRATLSAYKNVRTICQQHRSQIETQRKGTSRQLYTLLGAWVRPDTIRRLNKTLRGFEQDEWGKPVQFSPGPEGLHEYYAMHRRIVANKVEQVYKMLRNP